MDPFPPMTVSLSFCLMSYPVMSGPEVLSSIQEPVLHLRKMSYHISLFVFLLWYLNHLLPPRDPKDEVLRPSHHHSQGAAGGGPQLEWAEPRRSSGFVRFALDGNQTE